MDGTSRADRPRVVVLGAGFAGYHCLRRLEQRLLADAAEVIAVSPADYMLYVPLLPEVTAGILAPRQVAVPLRTHLPRTRLIGLQERRRGPVPARPHPAAAGAGRAVRR